MECFRTPVIIANTHLPCELCTNADLVGGDSITHSIVCYAHTPEREATRRLLVIADRDPQSTLHATQPVSPPPKPCRTGLSPTHRYHNPLVKPHVYASIRSPRRRTVNLNPLPLIPRIRIRTQSWWIVGHLALIVSLLLVPVTCNAVNGPHSLFMTMAMSRYTSTTDSPSAHAMSGMTHMEGMPDEISGDRESDAEDETILTQPESTVCNGTCLTRMPEPSSLTASSDAVLISDGLLDLPSVAALNASATDAIVLVSSRIEPPPPR